MVAVRVERGLDLVLGQAVRVARRVAEDRPVAVRRQAQLADRRRAADVERAGRDRDRVLARVAQQVALDQRHTEPAMRSAGQPHRLAPGLIDRVVRRGDQVRRERAQVSDLLGPPALCPRPAQIYHRDVGGERLVHHVLRALAARQRDHGVSRRELAERRVLAAEHPAVALRPRRVAPPEPVGRVRDHRDVARRRPGVRPVVDPVGAALVQHVEGERRHRRRETGEAAVLDPAGQRVEPEPVDQVHRALAAAADDHRHQATAKSCDSWGSIRLQRRHALSALATA